MLASLRSAAVFGVDTYPVHDEMPEFDRRVLEVLRQPLEEGHVTIARQRGLPCSPPAVRRVQHVRYGSGGPRTNAGLRGSRVAFCRPDAKGRQLPATGGRTIGIEPRATTARSGWRARR